MISRRTLGIMLMASLVAGCSGWALPLFSESSADDGTGFQLVIFKQSWFDLSLGYEAEHAIDVLKQTDRTAAMFTIGNDEIESYDWNTQSITLTQAATDQLIQSLTQLDPLSAGAERLKALKSEMGSGNALERALYIRAFAVYYDDDFLYGGIFLDAPSQMAISFPVIRVTVSHGQALLALLPVHVPFVMVDPVNSAGQIKQGSQASIAPEAAYDVEQLDKDGFFSTWMLSIAGSDPAQYFRSLIRDERVRNAFETKGKLHN